MICSQGDVVLVGFDPTLGHEPQKRRPAVVVSTDECNRMSSLTFVAPITSTDNGYPLHVRITSSIDVHGCICVEQTRSVDLDARPCKVVGRLGEDDMAEVLTRLGAIFGI